MASFLALCQILLMKRMRRLFLGGVFLCLRILKQHNAADKLIVITEAISHSLKLFDFPNRAFQSTIRVRRTRTINDVLVIMF